MIKFNLRLTFLVLFLGLGLFSCNSEEESNSSYEKVDIEKSNHQDSEELGITSYSGYDDEYTMLMVGYLGDAKITVELTSNGESLNGSYFYNKYNKPITLKGEYEEGADWGPMSLTETNEAGEITGYWDVTSSNQRLNYMSDGTWKHPKTGNELPIILFDKTDDMYLDDKSKMMFKSEKASIDFFKKHHFLNQETYNKPGYIIADNFQNQYEAPLPVGITIWSINSYNFDEDIAYTLLEGNKVKHQESGDIMDLAELTESNIEIDYEISAYRFQFVNNDQQFILEDGYRQIAINASDLEGYGYHAIGEGQWYKNNSGSVLGYFPSATVDYFDDKKENYTSPIFSEPDISSDVLLVDANENFGYFSVLDVKLVGIHYWAKVRFDYHEEVPCDGTLLVPEPSVTGWIRFYNDSKNITIDYYTRGC